MTATKVTHEMRLVGRVIDLSSVVLGLSVTTSRSMLLLECK